LKEGGERSRTAQELYWDKLSAWVIEFLVTPLLVGPVCRRASLKSQAATGSVHALTKREIQTTTKSLSYVTNKKSDRLPISRFMCNTTEAYTANKLSSRTCLLNIAMEMRAGLQVAVFI